MKLDTTMYYGKRDGHTIWVDGRLLSKVASLNVKEHATRFDWGYRGEAPAQLSLALLMDFIGLNSRAVAIYQAFKCSIIAHLPGDSDFTLPGLRIHKEVLRLERLKFEGRLVEEEEEVLQSRCHPHHPVVIFADRYGSDMRCTKCNLTWREAYSRETVPHRSLWRRR